MELKVVLKDQAPHALPHGAFFRIDPQDRRALRQGNIVLIHSAPTGDREAVVPGRCEASNPESRDSGSGAYAPSRNDESYYASLRRRGGLNARGEPSSLRPVAPA